ncbi:MAG TPA: RNA polymerase sigma factor [Bacteroidales bacterium]|nr:RNA polymerase sigma factor [Bacteroidales bacterium]HRZ77524.1 RNA polymerase sigma factor [Bacteroidales bacterium]
MKTLEEIIRGCQSGRQADQQLLYEKFSAKMYAICLRYTRDRTEAEDVLHEGFIRVFGAIRDFRGSGSFEGWMRRIMVNSALERFRRQHWLFPVEEIEEDAAVDWNGPEQVLGLSELLNMVSELPPRYRMVFNLCAIEGYPHHEVAGMLGISEGTSKSNLARARAILQRRLGHEYRHPGDNVNDYGRHG